MKEFKNYKRWVLEWYKNLWLPKQKWFCIFSRWLLSDLLRSLYLYLWEYYYLNRNHNNLIKEHNILVKEYNKLYKKYLNNR